jgi:protein-S-isoprenylcysteine O-methyltransferase Ste14
VKAQIGVASAREQAMTETSERPDIAGVIVFPPLIPLIVLAIGVPADWLVPLGWLDRIPLAVRAAVGLALAVGGLWIMQSGRAYMRRIGTNVRPTQPTLVLATEGVFAHTRNPLYLGALLALLGIILGFGLEWALVLFILSLPVLHYGVVRREERYLERKFAEAYLRYKARVPRYGWRF